MLFVNGRKISPTPFTKKEHLSAALRVSTSGQTQMAGHWAKEWFQKELSDAGGHGIGYNSHLVAAKRHLAAAPGAAAYVAVVADVAHSIGELGLKAYVTGGIQLDAGLLLLLGSLSDLHFQRNHLVLFAPAGGSRCKDAIGIRKRFGWGKHVQGLACKALNKFKMLQNDINKLVH